MLKLSFIEQSECSTTIKIKLFYSRDSYSVEM